MKHIITIVIDANYSNDIIFEWCFILVFAFICVTPNIAIIFSLFDFHIVHSTPNISIVAWICDIDATVEIHSANFLSTHDDPPLVLLFYFVSLG